MKFQCPVMAVADIKAAKKFYEELFGLEVYQDYGINVSFTCGLSLQQEFDWLVGLPKEKIITNANNMELCFEEERFDEFLEKLKEYPEIKRLGGVVEHSWGQRVIRFYDLDGHILEVGERMRGVVERFLASGLSMEEVSKRMDVALDDLEKILQE